MRLWAAVVSCVLVLGGSLPGLAQQQQQQTGPRTLETLLKEDGESPARRPSAVDASAPAAVTPLPNGRVQGLVTRPKDGVQHPDLDKAWADYDKVMARVAEAIRDALNKQFDTATAKGDLDAAEKWQIALEKFEKAGGFPAERETKASVGAAVADYKKARDGLAKAYEAVVKTLTMEKKIAEAKNARQEWSRLSLAEPNGLPGTRDVDAAPSMVCPGLGKKCNYYDGDWSGQWVRRGDSNIFDCRMFHGPARETATYVATLEVKGQNVVVRRTKYQSTKYGVRPPEQVDEYVWHFGQDGKSLWWNDPKHSRLERAE